MVSSIQIRVDKSLTGVMEDMRRKIATEIKGKYGVKEVTIPGTFTSQVIAAKLSGKKAVNFKLNKVSNDRGILELI